MYVAFAMGALGALLGIWIAWSESPVVVTVLPLLFGIVGSAGGYSLLKMDFSKPHNQEKLHVISLGVGTFCLTCLIFMVTAMVERPSLRELMTPDDVDITTSVSPLRTVIMRARLQALGATGKEIKFILKPLPSRAPDKDRLTDIVKDAGEYVQAYDAIPMNDQSVLNAGGQEASAGTIAIACKILLMENESLSASGKPIDNYRAALLIRRLTAINFDANPNTLGKEAQLLLVKYPKLIAARIRLIDDLQASKTLSDVISSNREVDEADRVLQILASSLKKARDPTEVAFSNSHTNF